MGNGRSRQRSRGLSKSVEGDVDDVAYLLRSHSDGGSSLLSASSSFISDSSFEIDASVIWRQDSQCSPPPRRKSFLRKRKPRLAQWDNEAVAEALESGALSTVVSTEQSKIGILEAVGAPPLGVRTFLTSGFGHRTELIIRILDKEDHEKITQDLELLAESLMRLSETSEASAIAAYKLIQTDLFPWDTKVIASQGKHHGLVLFPDPMLEPLCSSRSNFLAILALQPEEWELAKQVPKIPLHAFVSSETGAANPLLVNSVRRPSILNLGALEDLKGYLPAEESSAMHQKLGAIDFSVSSSECFSLIITQVQAASVFSLLESQLLGDVFGMRSLEIVPSNEGRSILFRNRRDISNIDETTCTDKIVIDTGDRFYGCLMSEVWPKVYNTEHPVDEINDDHPYLNGESDVFMVRKTIDLTYEFGGPFQFRIVVVAHI